MDFDKLWVNSHKDLLYKRYLIRLLQLCETPTKMSKKEFVLQQSFMLLTEFFFIGKSTNHITSVKKLFLTIVHDCKIWIWMLDVAGFVKRLLFIWFHCNRVSCLIKLQASGTEHLRVTASESWDYSHKNRLY